MGGMLWDDKEAQDRRLQLLLNTADMIQKNKIATEELALKKAEQDPRVQAGKLASMFAALGQTDQAERLFTLANGGSAPPPTGQTPPQQGVIPNYMGGASLQTNNASPVTGTASVGVAPGASMGVTGGKVKVGGSTLAFGTPKLDEMSQANLDIHKTVTTEGLKKQQETTQGAEKTLAGTDRYLKQFERSYEELKSADPDIDKVGYGGWLARNGAAINTALDKYPETSALQRMAKPLAQQIATDIEGRATDEDRKIQADAFANVLQGPSEANIRVASNSLLMLKDKGADISKVVKKLSKSKIDVIQKIVEQVYEEAPELRPKEVDVNDIFKGL